MLSQLVAQQNESTWQICVTHGSHPLCRAPPVTHLSCAQAPHCPQSTAQVVQVSPASQKPSPHITQLPQSNGQLWQVSPASQKKSPQVGQGPQSVAQVVQSSPASQLKSPHIGPHTPQSSEQVTQSSPESQAPSPQMVGSCSGEVEVRREAKALMLGLPLRRKVSQGALS